VTFTNNSQSANSYTWIFGNGNTQNTATNDAQTQVYSSNATVFLIANQNTCSDTFSLNLVVNTCGCTDPTALNYNPLANVSDGSCLYPFPTVEVFNVITPDGNGQNDLFFVNATNATEITLKIVNRWGNKILEETSLNPTWDGKVNGQLASEGVYFYTYSVKGINNETIEGHGFVELIK
jgi:gliding motility-associated-like protein